MYSGSNSAQSLKKSSSILSRRSLNKASNQTRLANLKKPSAFFTQKRSNSLLKNKENTSDLCQKSKPGSSCPLKCPQGHNQFIVNEETSICSLCEKERKNISCQVCQWSLCSKCQMLQHEMFCDAIAYQHQSMNSKEVNKSCIFCDKTQIQLYVECKNCNWLLCSSCFKADINKNKKHNNLPIQKNQFCWICLKEKATFMNETCGHLNVCSNDAKKLKKCPLCRAIGKYVLADIYAKLK